MKYLFYSIIIFCFYAVACNSYGTEAAPPGDSYVIDNKKGDTAEKTPVLVELFTSEGCSSCPPAERALDFLDKEQPYMQAEIITLALHVDYWNRLGWKDEFSSPLYSQRQQLYARKFRLDSEYTPQMVVDGNEEFNGSDLGKASKAVINTAKIAKAEIDLAWAEDDKLKISVANIPDVKESATLYVAVAENDLSSNVKSGENAGQTLRHRAVVRDLKAVGVINSDDKLFRTETLLPLQSITERKNSKVVVFLQQNASRRIIGVKQVFLEQKDKVLTVGRN